MEPTAPRSGPGQRSLATIVFSTGCRELDEAMRTARLHHSLK